MAESRSLLSLVGVLVAVSLFAAMVFAVLLARSCIALDPGPAPIGPPTAPLGLEAETK